MRLRVVVDNSFAPGIGYRQSWSRRVRLWEERRSSAGQFPAVPICRGWYRRRRSGGIDIATSRAT